VKKAVLLRSCAALFVPFAATTFLPTPAVAQETTSSITGTVMSAGRPVPNATVTITHVPSGTVLRTTTSADGTFTASGLRVGGPYTVAVASRAGSTSVTDIFTVAGQPFNLPVEIAPSSSTAIVVTATRVRGAGVIGTGPSTVLNANDISKVASVNRDIRDLMRRDPFATLDTSQSTGRQVTFAGTNPRFNRFTVDGVPITDSFGLNPDALPSRRGPVPLDAIGEFQTKVAPYDIREGFFQGGVINAILRSGTNHFQGTAFFTYSSDSLQGKQTKPYLVGQTGGTTADGHVIPPIPSYTSKDYGVELSGPLLKDRLFFMVAGERVRANLPFNLAGSTISSTVFDQIVNIAKTKYGVDAGGILSTQGDKDDRLVGRLDANIAEGQRLSLTGIYTKDQINTLGFNTTSTQSTLSNDYVKPNRVVAGVANWNATWSPVFSTETRAMYKDYRSGQNPILAKTALALVCSDPGTPTAITVGASATQCSTGVTSLAIGPLGSAQTNILHTKTFDFQELARFTFGNHNVRALYDYQHVSNYNLFIGQTASFAGGTNISSGAFGAYYFDSIAAFQAGKAQEFGYANATTGNPNDAAALFDYSTHTFGLQDDWRVMPTLTVTAGVRYDLYASSSRPLLNQAFVTREGFPNNEFMDGRGLLQPRVGFDWKATPRLDLHGGVGIFGGGTPDVYIGNSFSSSGVQPVLFSTNNASSPFLQNVNLTSVPAGATATLNGLLNAPVAAIDPNFKIPSQWRGSLSGTYDVNFGPLGDHWILGASALISKTREGILYRDGRIHPITGAGALTPDGRIRYVDTTPASAGGPSSNADTILGNTSRGHGYIGVVSLTKKWDFGLNAFASFTYQDVWDQAAVTSSIASSNYTNTAYLDANSGAFGHANDEVRYSVKYDLGFDHAFFRNARTRIDLFGETRIGAPYSYTMQEAGNVSSTVSRGGVFGTSGNTSRFLFYVPTGINDPLVTGTAADLARIDAIINSTGLKKYRGKIAPRNAFNSKWFTKIDLHVEQEIPTFVGRSKFSIFADIENLPNLLNHNWGQQLRNFFPFTDVVAKVACQPVGGNPCAQYKYSSPSTDSFLADQLITVNGSSLYTIRVGARLPF
jgi:Carboxypeptidase regulatory-like domain